MQCSFSKPKFFEKRKLKYVESFIDYSYYFYYYYYYFFIIIIIIIGLVTNCAISAYRH